MHVAETLKDWKNAMNNSRAFLEEIGRRDADRVIFLAKKKDRIFFSHNRGDGARWGYTTGDSPKLFDGYTYSDDSDYE